MKSETPWTDEWEVDIQGDMVVFSDEVRLLEKQLIAAQEQLTALTAELEEARKQLTAANAKVTLTRQKAEEAKAHYAEGNDSFSRHCEHMCEHMIELLNGATQ